MNLNAQFQGQSLFYSRVSASPALSAIPWLYWVSHNDFEIYQHFINIHVVVAANPMMRSTTNILIINLAVADLLFVIFCKKTL